MRCFVAVGAVLLMLSGCKVLEVPEAGRPTVEDWLTEGDGVERRNAVEMPLSPPLEERWDYNANAGFGPVSPLLVGPAVIVATRKGEVHAIDIETGKRLGLENFGDAIDGTPVVQDGLLFVPVEWGKRALFAYDLVRGTKVWKKKGAHVAAGLLALEEALIVVDTEATVTAYAPHSGDVLWEQHLGDDVTVHTTPVLARDAVVIADDAGGVVALDRTDGSVRWTYALDAPVYRTFATDGQTLFVPSTRGRFFALDAAGGGERWRYVVADTTVRFTTPAVDGNLVTFAASDGYLYGLDAQTGTERWTAAIGDALSGTPLVTRDWVYAGTQGRELVAVRRTTGEVGWRYTLPGRAKSAFAARGDALIVLCEPRHVILLASVPEGNIQADAH